MMKKYFLFALLMLSMFGMSNVYAQGRHHSDLNDREERKERKMDKKDYKVHRKMFRDKPGKAARKEYKSRKKEYKTYHSNRYYYKD